MPVVTKIITLDAPLRDERVLNSLYASARTVLQHEIVVWDPEQILDHYTAGSDYNNAACLTDHSSVAFLHDRRRRSQEVADFLALGRLLVVFVPAPFQWYYATGEKRNDGTAAKPRMTRLVDEVAIKDVLPVAVELVRGHGEESRLVAGAPFSSFWRAAGEQFYFSAYFGKRVGSTLLAMAGTDRPVAAVVEAHGGVVLLLPQLGDYEPGEEDIDADEDDPRYDEKYDAAHQEVERRYHGKFVDALLELHKELIGTSGSSLPQWAEDYLLPGEADAVATTIEAQDRLAEAQQGVEDAQAELVVLQRRKVLVTGTGKALEAQLHEVLSELGCDVEKGEPGRTDRIIRWGEKVAVLEVKGLTKSAKESDAAQLEKWVSEYIEKYGATPKAVLAVSAWREVPLGERKHPAFPPQMLKYSARREHCLIETGQMLAAAVTCQTKNAKDAFLRKMFETVGRFEGSGWETVLTELKSDEAQK